MNLRHISTICMLLLGTFSATARSQSLTLNYAAPSEKWMGSLPLGNGRIGAMVYGGVEKETIALNEVTLWSGQPDPDCNNLLGPEKLAQLRQHFLSGDLEGGNQLGWQTLNGHGRSFGTHLPLGDLVISELSATGKAADAVPSFSGCTGYSRQLALDEAVARVQYKYNKVAYQREYFTTNPDQALVIRYTASQPRSINVSVGLSLLRHVATINTGADYIDAEGDARFDKNGEGGVNWRAMVRVIADGGCVASEGDHLVVTGASAMTIVCDMRTNFQNPAYREQCQQTVDAAAAKPYKALMKAHVADYQRLFNRMSIDLAPGASAKEKLTGTDQLFAQAHAGQSNPVFDALFFQYGRYMQIASSRENSPLPSNLQGIWNDNLACNMPWTCDYHLDVNIEQNYWSANIANLAETNEPLFRYMALLVKYGHETAQKMYGCNGWVAHTINNVWGDTAPGNSLNWALNVTAGAWMMTHLWTHFEFTQDTDYLRTVGYPLLKETARFFMDYMVEDPRTGWLLSGPSISPENGFRTPDGHDYSLSMMPTIDRAVIYDIYHACIESARILGIDDQFRARLERDIQKLPPLQINDDGELKEWLVDGARRSDPSHRHASHLLALYPFGQISPSTTPELARACETFLQHQTSHPNWEDTEWTRGNNINFYARLLNGDKAYESLTGLYTGFMRENLMTVSPAGVAGAEEDIFSFDATEAAVAGVCEMLLQSSEEFRVKSEEFATATGASVGAAANSSLFTLHSSLTFLPALPSAWPSGAIKGVCARGGIEASFEWKDRRVTRATLRAKRDQTVTVLVNGTQKTVQLKAGKTVRIV